MKAKFHGIAPFVFPTRMMGQSRQSLRGTEDAFESYCLPRLPVCFSCDRTQFPIICLSDVLVRKLFMERSGISNHTFGWAPENRPNINGNPIPCYFFAVSF